MKFVSGECKFNLNTCNVCAKGVELKDKKVISFHLAIAHSQMKRVIIEG